MSDFVEILSFLLNAESLVFDMFALPLQNMLPITSSNEDFILSELQKLHRVGGQLDEYLVFMRQMNSKKKINERIAFL